MEGAQIPGDALLGSSQYAGGCLFRGAELEGWASKSPAEFCREKCRKHHVRSYHVQQPCRREASAAVGLCVLSQKAFIRTITQLANGSTQTENTTCRHINASYLILFPSVADQGESLLAESLLPFQTHLCGMGPCWSQTYCLSGISPVNDTRAPAPSADVQTCTDRTDCSYWAHGLAREAC